MASFGSKLHIPTEKGNALFLILIAVALFAALSYAVTKSSRSGKTDISQDKANIVASAVLGYGAGIKNAVTRVKISNSCTDEQLNFYTPLHWYDYTNPSAPSSKKCNIFDSAGGNTVYQKPEALLRISQVMTASDVVEHFIGNTDIPQIGTNCAAAACSDLYFVLSINENIPGAARICKALNRQLRLANPDTEISVSGGIWGWPPFVGTFTNPGGAIDNKLSNVQSMCYHDTVNPFYTYYQVLVAR